MRNSIWIITILLIFQSTLLFAENFKLRTWKIGKDFRTFVFFPKIKLLISQECVDLNKESQIYNKCKSQMDVIRNKPANLPNLKNGQHPGSIFCKEALGAEVRFASDERVIPRPFAKLRKTSSSTTLGL